MSYLRDRKRRVRLGEHTSEWMTFLNGVPQGPILCPRLFNIFLNKIMFALKHTDPVNYADDNTICAIANSLHEAIQKLVGDGNILIDKFIHNDMQADPSNFHLWSQVVAQLTLRAATIEQEDCVKLLGVSIDKK